MQEEYSGRPTGREHQMFSGAGTNAVEDTGPMGDYEIMCAMLVPMYAARATEVVFYGDRGATLSTAPDVSVSAGACHCWQGARHHWQGASAGTVPSTAWHAICLQSLLCTALLRVVSARASCQQCRRHHAMLVVGLCLQQWGQVLV